MRVIVCSAVRNKTTGLVVCGPRHGDCLNYVVAYGLDDHPKGDAWECGFVDQDGQFLTREQAWAVADAAWQIRRPTGFEKDYSRHRPAGIGDSGKLLSENLY